MEIERKYLVHPTTVLWKNPTIKQVIKQGYFTVDENVSVRLRKVITTELDGVSTIHEESFITIKTKNSGMSREECEARVILGESEPFFDFCPNIICKERLKISIDMHVWDVDIFSSPHDKLIIAEIELLEENESFEKPSWLGKEVTDYKMFYNENLNTREYVPILNDFLVVENSH